MTRGSSQQLGTVDPTVPGLTNFQRLQARAIFGVETLPDRFQRQSDETVFPVVYLQGFLPETELQRESTKLMVPAVLKCKILSSVVVALGDESVPTVLHRFGPGVIALAIKNPKDISNLGERCSRAALALHALYLQDIPAPARVGFAIGQPEFAAFLPKSNSSNDEDDTLLPNSDIAPDAGPLDPTSSPAAAVTTNGHVTPHSRVTQEPVSRPFKSYASTDKRMRQHTLENMCAQALSQLPDTLAQLLQGEDDCRILMVLGGLFSEQAVTSGEALRELKACKGYATLSDLAARTGVGVDLKTFQHRAISVPEICLLLKKAGGHKNGSLL